MTEYKGICTFPVSYHVDEVLLGLVMVLVVVKGFSLTLSERFERTKTVQFSIVTYQNTLSHIQDDERVSMVFHLEEDAQLLQFDLNNERRSQNNFRIKTKNLDSFKKSDRC